MSDRRVSVHHEGHVLRIGLNRPDKRNAFDLEMLEQLAAAYERLSDDPELRVGILHAHGAHFSAGLDLTQVWSTVVERATPDSHRTPPPACCASQFADHFGVEIPSHQRAA
jgi:enoyl-CoA hydratase